MPIVNDYVDMVWSTYQKKRYIDLGYKFTKIGDTFRVKLEDVSPTSNVFIDVICDYCGKEFKQMYINYMRGTKSGNSKCCCIDCRQKKYEENVMRKYGVKNTAMLDEVKEKERNTCIERYGVCSTALVPEVKEKLVKSMYKNNSCLTSKMQDKIHMIIGGKKNYPLFGKMVDILLDDNIYLEYDGGGHFIPIKFKAMSEEEFKNREIERYNFLRKNGYKMIKIVNRKDRDIPDELITSIVNHCQFFLKNFEDGYIIVDIENRNIYFDNQH